VPHCPSDNTAAGCEALGFALARNRTKLRFQCIARGGGTERVKCGAELLGSAGTDARATPTATRTTKGRVALQAEPVSDCAGPQFATTATRKLAKASNDRLASFIAKRIRKADRRFFDPGKAFCVRVRFTTKSGFSHTRLYEVSVPSEG
jgi:hypothetical protein